MINGANPQRRWPRWFTEPLGMLPNGRLNIVGEDEPPTLASEDAFIALFTEEEDDDATDR